MRTAKNSIRRCLSLIDRRIARLWLARAYWENRMDELKRGEKNETDNRVKQEIRTMAQEALGKRAS